MDGEVETEQTEEGGGAERAGRVGGREGGRENGENEEDDEDTEGAVMCCVQKHNNKLILEHFNTSRYQMDTVKNTQSVPRRSSQQSVMDDNELYGTQRCIGLRSTSYIHCSGSTAFI